ncbi:hypothetical protein E3E35_02930 [Thermococcus sp. GR7]|uniref:hypothetical protein n=1 Tax=unclassified Thermococcus TaxID=2627626 RepID=UPI00142FDEB6|nr:MULTISPECIES: hypothetical protein [unclassified Thermococcus]NJE46383.1 hypothetical protein [Thermococcus sp. GR7]NJE77698.1 hypothetical protein [Thermococcus sp. GR4]NJF23737.1 hypothetical protein [Thermococcus sp. GR5]
MSMMVTVEIDGDACSVVSMSSHSKLFEFLFENMPIQSLHYRTFLADKGVYIVETHGTKLLRLECPEGKKALLHELHRSEITPQVFLETYLRALFNVLDLAKIKEKVVLQYYVVDKFVQPVKIEIKDHPAGFRKGSFTLIDELIAQNYGKVGLGNVRKLTKIRYDPLDIFGGKTIGNTILIFNKRDLRELAFLYFDDYKTAKTLFTHTTDFYLNSVFFGHLKFKIRKFLGI